MRVIATHPFDVLRQGCDLLLDVLLVHGFELSGPYWQHPDLDEDATGRVAYARGENDARADLVHGDRAVALALWHRLRPPVDRLGAVRLGHGALMAAAGCTEPAYPPQSADPLEGFRALARDLAAHGDALTAGR